MLAAWFLSPRHLQAHSQEPELYSSRLSSAKQLPAALQEHKQYAQSCPKHTEHSALVCSELSLQGFKRQAPAQLGTPQSLKGDPAMEGTHRGLWGESYARGSSSIAWRARP